MKTLLFASLILAAPLPASAMDSAPLFHMARLDTDYAHASGSDQVTWDGEAWIGGDTNKLWLKSEGKIKGGATEDSEVQALWSHNIAPFWDAQAGLRVDLNPDTKTYLAFGVQGLAPYQFETEATGFVSEDGDFSARLKQSIDLLLTQRLILQPHIEANIYAQDVPERAIGAGFSDVNAGLQLRYEITRDIAPYLDLDFNRALGETAQIVRRHGDDVEETALRAGLRLWF